MKSSGVYKAPSLIRLTLLMACLDKKYRILDDCARLREALKSITDDQHVVPSLLLLSWDVDGSKSIPDELLEMVSLIPPVGKRL